MRKCIIVGNPGEQGENNYCDGVNKDVENYYQFLRSPLGGSWERRELTILDCPSLRELEQELALVTPEDYFLFVFSGHGDYSADSESTILGLSVGAEFDSMELREYGYAKLIILDCCREVRSEIKEGRILAEAVQRNPPPDLHREKCRKYYDDLIYTCRESIIVLNSCSIDELSGDDAQRGGYFSFSFLRSIREIYNRSRINTDLEYQEINAPSAFEETRQRVQRLSGNIQNPVIEKARSGPYLPVGIIA